MGRAIGCEYNEIAMGEGGLAREGKIVGEGRQGESIFFGWIEHIR